MEFQPVQNSQDRTWAMFAHLGGIIGFAIPFGTVLIPLVIWLLKKQEYPFVEEHGKEALNFQISMLIYTIISGCLVLILIGVPLLIGVFIFDIVQIIKASIAANNGQPYRYPLTIRVIK